MHCACAILSSVVCPVLQCFSTLFHKRYRFRKKNGIERKINNAGILREKNTTVLFMSVINQLDAQNFCFTISLFHACTCFEHMCSSPGGQNCITQPLVSSRLYVAVLYTRDGQPVVMMIPEAT